MKITKSFDIKFASLCFYFHRYGATCEYLVQSGLCVLRESERIPGSGGVYTPGYAFKDTTLVERCNMNDVPFVAVVKDL